MNIAQKELNFFLLSGKGSLTPLLKSKKIYEKYLIFMNYQWVRLLFKYRL
jgi:hypothetical protein